MDITLYYFVSLPSVSLFSHIHFETLNWKINMRFFIPSFFPWRVSVCVCVYFVRTLPIQQDEIESTMDEAANDRTNIICHSIKEAATQTGGFIFETVLNATNTRNSGKSI